MRNHAITGWRYGSLQRERRALSTAHVLRDEFLIKRYGGDGIEFDAGDIDVSGLIGFYVARSGRKNEVTN